MRQEGAEVALRSGCVPRPAATLLQGCVWTARIEQLSALGLRP